MNYTLTEALDIINRANGTNYTSLEQVASAANSTNEGLKDMINKITKMMIVDTFNADILSKFRNVFVHADEKLEVGALAEVVDVSLLPVDDDIITTPTDLLPKLDAVSAQYVIRLARNIKKRIELTINEAVFVRAFTTINAFNSFMTLIVKRIKDSEKKYLFDFIISQALISVYNGKDMGTGSSLDLIKGIYTDLGQYEPYTDQLNLGAIQGATTIPISTSDNNVGMDTPQAMPVKINTLAAEMVDGVEKWTNMVIFTSKKLTNEIYNDLATIFHSDFLSIQKRFPNIIPMPQTLYNKQLADLNAQGNHNYDKFVMAIDKHALVFLWNLTAEKSQLWAKGEGKGLRQLVYSFWASAGYIPWNNGRYWVSTSPSATVQQTYFSEVQALGVSFSNPTNAITAAALANMSPILQTALRGSSTAHTVIDIANIVVQTTTPAAAGTAATPTEATATIVVPALSGSGAVAPTSIPFTFYYKNA